MNKFLSIVAGVTAAGLMLCGSTVQAQSTITGVYPNGTNMFQPSSTLSFTASSPAGVTNVTVQLTVTSLYSGQSFVKNLTAVNGLTITGPTTGLSVSAVLNSNTLYSAAIQVKDANGNVASQTVNFDTIIPSYTWEGEDWDYTSNSISGLYIDNPQINAYAGLGTTDNVDAHNANGNSNPTYRPAGITASAPGGLWTEVCGDSPKRLAYIGTTNVDWDVGFTSGGAFGQYTRHYPAGIYNLFVRTAGGGGVQTESADITVTAGTAAINSPASGPYKYGVKGNGWGSYDFMPVTDSGGNLVQITFDGNPSTLKVLQVQAADNIQFFMLMPTNVVIPSTVTVTNVSPDGSALFNPAGTFSFNAYSPSAPVDANNIIVQVTATNLWGHGSVSSLSASSGLTITGPSTNLSVSLITTTNTIYSIVIQTTDANGTPSSSTASFDTIIAPPVTPAANANFTFEAEDFDYGSGQHFDDPQTNAYNGFDGTAEVDFHATLHGADYNRLGLTTENLNEKQRPQYNGTGKQDYDVGFNEGGNWGNYTRNYPAGTYNIWVRASNGTGNTSADSGSISLVTSGVGTSSQTLSQLGKFSVPAIAWATYGWYPVKDAAGNLAEFTGGSLETLRMTIDGGNCNENFFLLTPADPNNILQPYVDGFTPDGSAMFQSSNTLSFVVHSQPGTVTSNIGLNLNGANVSGLVFSGTANTRNVSYSIQTNKIYTAIVTVTDSNGTTKSTNYFDTLDSNTTYTFEVEDYDYSGGQFIDNPQIGAYSGHQGVLDVDDHWNYNTGIPYRPSAGVGEGLPFENPSGDVIRSGYGSADYNVGHNDGGNWANYTRHYPAGTYNIWMRYASPNGSPNITDAAKISLVTGGWGTTSQAATQLGTFTTHNTGGWGTYVNGWVPLMDVNGTMAQFVSDGSTNTLRYTVDNGGFNLDFFALVPADTNLPVIADAYPNGAYRFQTSSTLSFTASCAAGINGSGISVLLTGTNLLGQMFTTNITTANGLSVSGSSTSLNASLNLAANTIYTVVITITGLNGEQATSTLHFDTISPSYTFEAEDWNYTTNSSIAGLFINNPQTNAYAGLASTAGIDYSNSVLQGGSDYRPQGLETENAGVDSTPPRQQYTGGKLDYNVGFNSGGSGNWANYTRTFPDGVYNIYLRGANGNGEVGSVQADAASMYLVTSAATNANQTTLQLGTFSVANLGGWGTYGNVPLIDSDGNYAEFVGGSQQTLRVTTDNGNYNANYYFLVPADNTLPVNPPHLRAALAGTKMVVSFLSRTNTTYVLQFKSSLTDPDWTPVSTNSGTALWMSITNTTSGGSGFYSLKP